MGGAGNAIRPLVVCSDSTSPSVFSIVVAFAITGTTVTKWGYEDLTEDNPV
jgi:hypothetical protein